MTSGLVLTASAYFLGSVPTSYWLGRWMYGVDLRRQGSGNLGATNTLRVLGLNAAAPVLVVDVLKGWVPPALFPLLTPELAGGWPLVYGAAAICGHVFSLWVGFRGGKGVATSAGVFLALAPMALAACLAIWTATVVLTRYVSLGSLLAAVALPAAVILTASSHGPALIFFAVALSAFVIWAHRDNIARLVRGEEARLQKGPREGEP